MVAIAGPTGAGKSELALRLAIRFHGEVVNCDSVQIYRFFDIGTAKLAAADRCDIPHHLIDIAEPTEVFTAGDYARVARPILREIAARDALPLVTGGTGFYLRALIHGLAPGPAKLCARDSGNGNSAGRDRCIGCSPASTAGQRRGYILTTFRKR